MNIGQHVFLQINGDVKATGLFVQEVYVVVCDVTEKAWKMRVVLPGEQIDRREFWLPKEAVRKAGKDRYKLVSWFEPDKYQGWIFNNAPVTGFTFSV